MKSRRRAPGRGILADFGDVAKLHRRRGTEPLCRKESVREWARDSDDADGQRGRIAMRAELETATVALGRCARICHTLMVSPASMSRRPAKLSGGRGGGGGDSNQDDEQRILNMMPLLRSTGTAMGLLSRVVGLASIWLGAGCATAIAQDIKTEAGKVSRRPGSRTTLMFAWPVGGFGKWDASGRRCCGDTCACTARCTFAFARSNKTDACTVMSDAALKRRAVGTNTMMSRLRSLLWVGGAETPQVEATPAEPMRHSDPCKAIGPLVGLRLAVLMTELLPRRTGRRVCTPLMTRKCWPLSMVTELPLATPRQHTSKSEAAGPAAHLRKQKLVKRGGPDDTLMHSRWGRGTGWCMRRRVGRRNRRRGLCGLRTPGPRASKS